MKLTKLSSQCRPASREAGASLSQAPPAGKGREWGKFSPDFSAEDVQPLQAMVQRTPEIRLEKIRTLKEQVERGDYQVDCRKVAEKMLTSLLSESTW